MIFEERELSALVFVENCSEQFYFSPDVQAKSIYLFPIHIEKKEDKKVNESYELETNSKGQLSTYFERRTIANRVFN